MPGFHRYGVTACISPHVFSIMCVYAHCVHRVPLQSRWGPSYRGCRQWPGSSPSFGSVRPAWWSGRGTWTFCPCSKKPSALCWRSDVRLWTVELMSPSRCFTSLWLKVLQQSSDNWSAICSFDHILQCLVLIPFTVFCAVIFYIFLQPLDELRTVVFEILKKKEELHGKPSACHKDKLLRKKWWLFLL